ncbi:MAG: homoserine dehydrogenase [Clostridium sp.]|nr:homoserine dehydrogenase [Clostridium sp.]
MKKVKLGLIGLGTVGSGVVKVLKDFPEIEIKKIAVKNINKKRNIDNLDTSILTTDPFEIVNDKEIDIVVEVIGGTDPAYNLLKTAVNNGKHIVTANKELLAKNGQELFDLANKKNTAILYEAAIAGGIPIIMPIKTTLAGNKINKIEAILNGTTNYILTKMEEDGVSYETVLKEAQALGYAETDPTGDVEGFDSAYKIATLATIALNQRVDINKIYREGITHIDAKDMKFAKELGYKIKLIALAHLTEENKADVRVHPMLVPIKDCLASINGVTNSVVLEGFPVGRVMMAGPGAGEFPTASSVVGDILAIVKSLGSGNILPLMKCNHEVNAEQININDTENKYYLSITAVNTPGVIGCIGEICGRHHINLSSVLQKGIEKENTAQIVIITEKSKEKNINEAITELKNNSNIIKINNLIRVME